jgi:Uma2 family endonuclease
MSTVHDPIQQAEWVSDDQPHPGRRMTEEEFVAWVGEKTRAEWVDGEVVVMSPASGEHSDLGGWLYMVLRRFVRRRHLGVIRGPEFMVRLGQRRRRRLPDVLFVAEARRDILRRNHVEGAPDLIMEVVSPESVSRDWREKYLDYEAAGVREYWVIDPMSRRAEAYHLGTNGSYQPIGEKDDKIASVVLPGSYLRPSWLWQENQPDDIDVLREMGLEL